jgi:hypothetical protein
MSITGSSVLKMVMWHLPIGREVTGYNPYQMCTGSTPITKHYQPAYTLDANIDLYY